jgi:hypothetical protein
MKSSPIFPLVRVSSKLTFACDLRLTLYENFEKSFGPCAPPTRVLCSIIAKGKHVIQNIDIVHFLTAGDSRFRTKNSQRNAFLRQAFDDSSVLPQILMTILL